MRSAANRFYPGDVLYSRLRPYLNKVWSADRAGLCSSEFIVLPGNDQIDPHFLCYRLNSNDFVAFATHLNAGDRPRVDFDQIALFESWLPGSMDEQHKIVAEIEKQLTRLDAGVVSLKRAQANLKRYRAAVLKAACEGRLVPTEAGLVRKEGRSYETGEHLLSRILAERLQKWQGKGKYKEPLAPDTSSLVSLPEGWTWATPDQLSVGESNSICAGPFGTIFKAKDFRPSGAPIIFLRHVAPGKYLTHKPGFMDHDKWTELFRPYSVFGGELLVTKLGEPPGICAIYPEGIGAAMVTPDVIKMSVAHGAACPGFLMHYFNSETARRFATGAAFGTTRLRLTIPIFRKMPVPLPPLVEQERIVAQIESSLSVVEEVEALAVANLQRAARLRQSILQEAFNGQLSHGDK
jgi:type I restriction enzyme S subunit